MNGCPPDWYRLLPLREMDVPIANAACLPSFVFKPSFLTVVQVPGDGIALFQAASGSSTGFEILVVVRHGDFSIFNAEILVTNLHPLAVKEVNQLHP